MNFAETIRLAKSGTWSLSGRVVGLSFASSFTFCTISGGMTYDAKSEDYSVLLSSASVSVEGATVAAEAEAAEAEAAVEAAAVD